MSQDGCNITMKLLNIQKQNNIKSVQSMPMEAISLNDSECVLKKAASHESI